MIENMFFSILTKAVYKAAEESFSISNHYSEEIFGLTQYMSKEDLSYIYTNLSKMQLFDLRGVYCDLCICGGNLILESKDKLNFILKSVDRIYNNDGPERTIFKKTPSLDKIDILRLLIVFCRYAIAHDVKGDKKL